MTTPHTDPTLKHDFVFLIDISNGNPNGDPDGDNRPRTDPETGHGLITDVAIKRKIRDTIAILSEGKPGYEIYVEAGTALNTQHERAYTTLNLPTGKDGKPQSKTVEAQAQQWMRRNFYDVRMFGGVMSTGTKTAGKLRGPLQLEFSRSVDPITPVEHGITRVTRTREDDKKDTEMGAKHTIPYGLYVGIGHYSAPLGIKAEVTTDDLTMLWHAITIMFEHDRAAARASMALQGLHIFTHHDAYGTAPAHKLTNRVHIERTDPNKPPRSINDYKITVDLDHLPDGITHTTLVD